MSKFAGFLDDRVNGENEAEIIKAVSGGLKNFLNGTERSTSVMHVTDVYELLPPVVVRIKK